MRTICLARAYAAVVVTPEGGALLAGDAFSVRLREDEKGIGT